MEESHIRRVGAAAVGCALVLRLVGGGVPGRLAEELVQPDAAAFLVYLETGRNVRFSPSEPGFTPEFAESPPAEAAVEVLADFSEAAEIPLYNPSGETPDWEALLEAPLDLPLHAAQPTVLILHTHATESYEGVPGWRTEDENRNMLAIGARVAELLEGQGIPTVQLRTLHDHPSYNGSYVRARESIREALDRWPDIRLVLDLHRDASDGANGQMRTQAQVGGRDSAQLMLVMGSNHENYQQNLSLALKLHAQLEHQAPGIMRPLQLRPSRFNQDLSPGALLIEVGAAGNTQQEALTAAEQLAQAIAALAG
ncbi:MAG: stage II sporulation protein P [Eubacteriales bacterium]|nr:stage II sporulation protein P [Eubacteriales bacterium]